MSKQETVNTFTEGLVMDLNPITTPDNVLTNALNATLITYNGNEFVLQNDMGNGRVETAYLPAGYVPVGIKEYGGIIYVASYNPLTNKGQIGSFPSPERNISSDEISQAKEPIISPSSFGELTAAGSQFSIKLKLFADDVIVRSGDKFSILLKSESDLSNLQKFVSNCLNSSKKKVTSPKNKLLTLTVAVLDSNNNFRDITDKLKRFDENNKEITFDITDSEILKLNSGFFTQTFEGDPTNIDEYRKQRAVNTYNNKVFGELYLIVTLNTIDSIDVEVEGYVSKDGTPIKISDDYTLIDGTALIFTLNYKYNCPDGIYEEDYPEPYQKASDEFKAQYSTYYGKKEEFYPSQVIHGAVLNTSGMGSALYKIPFEVEKNDENTYPSFNSNSNLYTKKQSTYLTFSNTSGILNYTITPCMIYAPLSGLTIAGSVNLSKLGTGSIGISNWRYYKNPNSMTLTWGLEAYPLTGTYIDSVYMELFDVLKNNISPVKTIVPSKKRSYNGVFTETVQFDEIFKEKKLYLTRIVCVIKNLIGTESETRVLGYRWLFTTDLYNNLYFGNIYDFYNFGKSELDEYNKVKLDVDISHTSPKKELETKINGELSSRNEPAGDDKFFDCRKTSTTSVSCVLESFSKINNPNHYPFTLDESGINTYYDTGEDKGTLTIGDIKFYGQRSSYKNIVVDNPENIVNRYNQQSFEMNNFKNHQFYITHESNSNNLLMSTRLVSQIVGNSIFRDVPIAHPFYPFVDSDEERFTRVFGFSPEVQGNSFAKKFFAIAAAAKERSGHGDEHWIRLWNLSKPGTNQDMNPISSDRTELLSEKNQHGDGARTHYVKDVWDEYSSLITDIIGKVPIVILQGATMNSGNNGFDNDYYNRCDLFVGSSSNHYTRYQILLWNTGSKYIPSRYFVSYSSTPGNNVELPQAIVDTYKNIYIYSEDSGVVQLYVMSSENYTYNDDYSAEISCSVKVRKSGSSDLLVVDDIPFNTTIQRNMEAIIESDSILSLEEKTSIKSKLLPLATFVLEEGSSIYTIVEKVDAIGMESEYISNNAMITSGYSSAIVTDSKIFDRDINGAPLSASVMYYVGDNATSVQNAANVSGVSSYVSKLKVDKLNGRTTLLAKGSNSTISKNVYQEEVKSGDSATYVKWEGLPVIDIKYKIPKGGTERQL